MHPINKQHTKAVALGAEVASPRKQLLVRGLVDLQVDSPRPVGGTLVHLIIPPIPMCALRQWAKQRHLRQRAQPNVLWLVQDALGHRSAAAHVLLLVQDDEGTAFFLGGSGRLEQSCTGNSFLFLIPFYTFCKLR